LPAQYDLLPRVSLQSPGQGAQLDGCFWKLRQLTQRLGVKLTI